MCLKMTALLSQRISSSVQQWWAHYCSIHIFSSCTQSVAQLFWVFKRLPSFESKKSSKLSDSEVTHWNIIPVTQNFWFIFNQPNTCQAHTVKFVLQDGCCRYTYVHFGTTISFAVFGSATSFKCDLLVVDIILFCIIKLKFLTDLTILFS